MTEAEIIIGEPEVSEILPEPRNRLLRVGRIADKAVGLTILGLAVYGGHKLVESVDVPFVGDDSNTYAEGVDDVEQMYNYYRYMYEGISDTELTKALGIDYINSRHAFNNMVHHEFATNDIGDAKSEWEAKQKDLIIQGVNIAGMSYEGIRFATDGKSVKIAEVGELSLDSKEDMVLLDQYVLNVISLNALGDEEKYMRNLNSISWLINSNARLRVEEGQVGFVDDDRLIYFADFYKNIQELGYSDLPSIWLEKFEIGTVGGGSYTGEIHHNDRGSAGVLIHEAAHAIAATEDMFSQVGYDQKVADATLIAMRGNELLPENLYLTEYARVSTAEDFAETMEFYFLQGNDFKNKLKLLRETNAPEYAVLKTKYEFMQDFFGGKEFLVNGIEFNPLPGDTFMIEDPDPSEEPIPIENGNIVAYLLHGNTVNIVEGSRQEYYPFMDMRTDFYKVEVEVNGEKLQGWISDIWMGGKLIWPAEEVSE